MGLFKDRKFHRASFHTHCPPPSPGNPTLFDFPGLLVLSIFLFSLPLGDDPNPSTSLKLLPTKAEIGNGNVSLVPDFSPKSQLQKVRSQRISQKLLLPLLPWNNQAIPEAPLSKDRKPMRKLTDRSVCLAFLIKFSYLNVMTGVMAGWAPTGDKS